MTATYSIDRDTLIKAAMQTCQALAKGQSPDATDLTDCSLHLNAMLKFWNTQGYKAWLLETITWPSVAAKVSYTLGEAGADVTTRKPLRMPQAYTMDANGNKTPLQMVEKANFEMLTPKAQPGPANSFYYTPNTLIAVGGLATNDGLFYPWPVPTDALLSFNAIVQRPIEDILGGGAMDVPQEAYLALIWGLAELVGPMFGTSESLMKRIEQKAPLFLNTALDFWEEDGSVFFQPSGQVR